MGARSSRSALPERSQGEGIATDQLRADENDSDADADRATSPVDPLHFEKSTKTETGKGRAKFMSPNTRACTEKENLSEIREPLCADSNEQTLHGHDDPTA
jgi:hypothetical protein